MADRDNTGECALCLICMHILLWVLLWGGAEVTRRERMLDRYDACSYLLYFRLAMCCTVEYHNISVV